MKLNLGCGAQLREGYDNIDLKGGKDVIKLDLRDELPYKKGTVDEIYASHIIEHFTQDEAITMLCEWHTLLKKGGTLELWTPDFHKLVVKYVENPDKFSEVAWRLYANPEDPHKAIYNFQHLSCILGKILSGFKDIEYLEEDKHPFPGRHKGIQMGLRCVK